MATRLDTYHKVIDLLTEAKQQKISLQKVCINNSLSSNYLYQAVRNIKLQHDIENALYQEVVQLYDDVVNKRWDTDRRNIEDIFSDTVIKSTTEFKEEYTDELPDLDLKAEIKRLLSEYNGEELKEKIEKLID
jgi:hypothetical protein|nr:MAG TPA: hypothetical protein [Caudoviricetes sp.]